jgi:aldehyde dehydrogenase (NAD+)
MTLRLRQARGLARSCQWMFEVGRMKRYDAYMAGAFVGPQAGQWFDTINPYSGEVWAQIARSAEADVDAAVNAARAAFRGDWGRIKPSQRGRLLHKLADLVEQNAEALALTETRDNGKVYVDNCMQIRLMAEFCRYYGGLADKIEGSVTPVSTPNVFNFTRYESLGVVALITPWNSPLAILAGRLAAALAAALAAGNTVVIKPSEFTSAATLEFMALIEQAGFPPGVVNVVTGFGNEVGAALVSHRRGNPGRWRDLRLTAAGATVGA